MPHAMDEEVEVELTNKTTILLTPELHEHLSRLAEQQGVSLGELVRRACERQYGLVSREQREQAVRALAELCLPVGSPADMKAESVPSPDELMP